MKIVSAPKLSEPRGAHGEHLYVLGWDDKQILRIESRHADYPKHIFAHGSFWELSGYFDEPYVRYDRLDAVGIERLELR